jgi:hypothetical protein
MTVIEDELMGLRRFFKKLKGLLTRLKNNLC